jgi:hypothetical protein
MHASGERELAAAPTRPYGGTNLEDSRRSYARLTVGVSDRVLLSLKVEQIDHAIQARGLEEMDSEEKPTTSGNP